MPVYNYVELTGVILVDTVDIRTGVQNEWLAPFGSDLNLNPQTPQGLQIAIETTARDAVARNNAVLANQINPNEAGGVYIDALWALTGGARNSPKYTLVPGVTLAGVAGTVIPEGVTMRSTIGDIYASLSTVTLDVDGNNAVDFQAITAGPLVCNVGDLTQIVQGEPGWETAINSNAGIPGNIPQSDQSSKFYRKETLGAQGTALPVAIKSKLMFVPGVRSNEFRENETNNPIVIEGVTLVPHSVYLCVNGGSDTAVATALLSCKSPGANWNGSTTVNVTDPTTGQIYPVSFDRPTLVPILCRITISAASTVADPVGSTIAAILAYVNGLLENEDGFVVGADVSPFELAGAVNREAPGIFVTLCEVALSVISPVYGTATLPILISEKATLAADNIVVIQI